MIIALTKKIIVGLVSFLLVLIAVTLFSIPEYEDKNSPKLSFKTDQQSLFTDPWSYHQRFIQVSGILKAVTDALGRQLSYNNKLKDFVIPYQEPVSTKNIHGDFNSNFNLVMPNHSVKTALVDSFIISVTDDYGWELPITFYLPKSSRNIEQLSYFRTDTPLIISGQFTYQKGFYWVKIIDIHETRLNSSAFDNYYYSELSSNGLDATGNEVKYPARSQDDNLIEVLENRMAHQKRLRYKRTLTNGYQTKTLFYQNGLLLSQFWDTTYFYDQIQSESKVIHHFPDASSNKYREIAAIANIYPKQLLSYKKYGQDQQSMLYNYKDSKIDRILRLSSDNRILEDHTLFPFSKNDWNEADQNLPKLINNTQYSEQNLSEGRLIFTKSHSKDSAELRDLVGNTISDLKLLSYLGPLGSLKHFQFSNDIVYSSQLYGNYQLFIYNYRFNTNRSLKKDEKYHYLFPQISPDEKYVACIKRPTQIISVPSNMEHLKNEHIAIIDIATSTELTTLAGNDFVWHPNSKQLLYIRNFDSRNEGASQDPALYGIFAYTIENAQKDHLLTNSSSFTSPKESSVFSFPKKQSVFSNHLIFEEKYWDRTLINVLSLNDYKDQSKNLAYQLSSRTKEGYKREVYISSDGSALYEVINDSDQSKFIFYQHNLMDLYTKYKIESEINSLRKKIYEVPYSKTAYQKEIIAISTPFIFLENTFGTQQYYSVLNLVLLTERLITDVGQYRLEGLNIPEYVTKPSEHNQKDASTDAYKGEFKFNVTSPISAFPSTLSLDYKKVMTVTGEPYKLSTIQIWSIEGTKLKEFPVHLPFKSYSWSKDSSLLALNNGVSVQVVDAANGKVLLTFKHGQQSFENNIYPVAISSDNSFIGAIGKTESGFLLSIYDRKSGTIVFTKEIEAMRVNDLLLSYDNSFALLQYKQDQDSNRIMVEKINWQQNKTTSKEFNFAFASSGSLSNDDKLYFLQFEGKASVIELENFYLEPINAMSLSDPKSFMTLTYNSSIAGKGENIATNIVNIRSGIAVLEFTSFKNGSWFCKGSGNEYMVSEDIDESWYSFYFSESKYDNLTLKPPKQQLKNKGHLISILNDLALTVPLQNNTTANNENRDSTFDKSFVLSIPPDYQVIKDSGKYMDGLYFLQLRKKNSNLIDDGSGNLLPPEENREIIYCFQPDFSLYKLVEVPYGRFIAGNHFFVIYDQLIKSDHRGNDTYKRFYYSMIDDHFYFHKETMERQNIFFYDPNLLLDNSLQNYSTLLPVSFFDDADEYQKKYSLIAKSHTKKPFLVSPEEDYGIYSSLSGTLRSPEKSYDFYQFYILPLQHEIERPLIFYESTFDASESHLERVKEPLVRFIGNNLILTKEYAYDNADQESHTFFLYSYKTNRKYKLSDSFYTSAYSTFLLEKASSDSKDHHYSFHDLSHFKDFGQLKKSITIDLSDIYNKINDLRSDRITFPELTKKRLIALIFSDQQRENLSHYAVYYIQQGYWEIVSLKGEFLNYIDNSPYLSFLTYKESNDIYAIEIPAIND